MASPKTVYTCHACGASSPRWLGKCPGCGAWNSLVEAVAEAATGGRNRLGGAFAALAPSTAVQPLAAIEAVDVARSPTGQAELDRVLGGGLVAGGVVLIGGDPGIGKSTLLLQALDSLQRAHPSTAGPPQGASAPSGGSATGAAVERGGRDPSTAGPPQGASAPSAGSATGQAFGCLNIHASLLPRWRGAAPIHRAIEAGDAQTGVTIMQMDAGLDTGDMLLAQALPIGPRTTTASLHDELAALGGQLIVQALQQAAQGRLRPTPQPAEGVCYAHKIDKHEAAIDWHQPAAQIERRIRAFDPFPGASSQLGDTVVKLWSSEIDSCSRPSDARCGQILAVDEGGIAVACADAVLRLTELQRPGGKRLPAREFLRGFALAPGQCLGEGTGGAP